MGTSAWTRECKDVIVEVITSKSLLIGWKQGKRGAGLMRLLTSLWIGINYSSKTHNGLLLLDATPNTAVHMG